MFSTLAALALGIFMSILDQAERWNAVDPACMRSLVESFPQQVESAAAAGRKISIPLPAGIKVLVVTGLGGSAIGGDLLRTIGGPELKVPLIVNRDYDLPGFLDASSLVVACSYSGNTEETLSAYAQARAAHASIVCITSGGRLEQLARADGVPVLSIPAGIPPRAALGHALITLMAAIHALGLIPEIDDSVRETVELLKLLRTRYGLENPEKTNSAKMLASSLHGKIAAVYGSSGMTEGAAYRWRTQIAENAKNMVFHHVLPEMNHNELVGWVYPQDLLKGIGVVFLRDKGDRAQVQRRFDLTRELIKEKAGTIQEVWSEGNTRLARLVSLTYLGDFVSLYLSYLNGVDPTPVKVIDYLKRELGSSSGR
jgi:glucose/mannose-6-phosphate isomerase